MSIVLITAFFLVIYVGGDGTGSLIVDYFNYKRVPSVVGYSCNSLMDDLVLVKNFNINRMKISLRKLNDGFGIHTFGDTQYFKLGIFVDARCHPKSSLTSFFSEASNYRMYDELRYWLILSYNFNDIMSSIGDEALGVSTDLVIAVMSDDENYSKLYDVYNFGKTIGGPLNVTLLGYWNKGGTIFIILTETRSRRRSNLHGINLRAAFLKTVYKPQGTNLCDYFQDYSSAQKESLSKFGYSLVTHLSEFLNFSLTSFQASNWEIGDRVGPIVRALNNNVADLSGTPMTMNPQRTHLVKFVHQDWPFRTCFIFRNPQPKNIKVQEILRPLSDEVWYLIVLLLSLSMIVLLAIVRYDWNYPEIMNMSHTFLLIIGSLCQQGTDLRMKNLSTRIAYLSLLIFGLLIYNYYSAGVVSARLNEPIVRINDSLNELGKLPLKLASEFMVYFDFFIKRTDWETRTFYTQRWELVPESDRFMLPEKAMQLVQTGQYAYHAHPEVAYPFVDRFYDNHEICELTEVHLARPTWSTFALTFNSTIVEVVRIGMVKITEVGLRARQINRWQYKKPRCRKDVLRASSINIYEFLPHVFLLLIGCFMATITFITEIIIANHFNYSKIKLKKSYVIYYDINK